MTPATERYIVVAFALVVGIACGVYVALAPAFNPSRTTPAHTAAAAPQAPAVPAPTAPPATVAPAITSPPATTTTSAPHAVTTTTPAPAVAAPPATPTAPAPSTTPKAPARSRTIQLDPDAASVYNPAGVAVASFGKAARAIDGNPLTTWSYRLDRATAGVTNAGLDVDLKSQRHVEAIKIETTTPEMAVTVYGTAVTPPAAIADPAWVALASRSSLGVSTTVKLDTHGHAFGHLLVWITHAPPGVNIGAVTISELSITAVAP